MTSWRFTNRVKTLKKKSYQVLGTDMNQFKSVWGLMLGILPLGVNRPGEAGLPPLVVSIPEAHEDR
jgi:hypothetical protein